MSGSLEAEHGAKASGEAHGTARAMKRKNKTNRGLAHHFVVDLHGMRTYEAMHALDLELNQQFVRGVTGGRVICGHGSGALLRAIGNALAQSPLVIDHRRDGDLGAYVVTLHAARDLEMP